VQSDSKGKVKYLRFPIILFLTILCFGISCCRHELTAEQKQQIADLRQQLEVVRANIAEAQKENATFSRGGFIGNLIVIRLNVLKTNEALLEERIGALESGARITTTVEATKPNPARAAELASEIEKESVKLREAQAQSDRYSGGLVKAVDEMSVATLKGTIAMLDQQYLVAKFGIAVPTLGSTARVAASTSPPETTSAPAPTPASSDEAETPQQCIKLASYDSSILSSNSVFVELAWKVDLSNSCDKAFQVRVTFKIYGKDEFELDTDTKDLYVGAHDIGKARGKMLVSPPEKAHRMAKQGASISEL
jgi:hypothetical protein